MQEIINNIKIATNNNDNIIYRKKTILNKVIYLIYNETITEASTISDFIIRSLNHV